MKHSFLKWSWPLLGVITLVESVHADPRLFWRRAIAVAKFSSLQTQVGNHPLFASPVLDPVAVFDNFGSNAEYHGDLVSEVVSMDVLSENKEVKKDDFFKSPLQPRRSKISSYSKTIFPSDLEHFSEAELKDLVERACEDEKLAFFQELRESDLLKSAFNIDCGLIDRPLLTKESLQKIVDESLVVREYLLNLLYRYAFEGPVVSEAKVFNFSFTQSSPDAIRFTKEFIQAHPSKIFVLSAGNTGIGFDEPTEYKQFLHGFQLTLCELPNVICVAASDDEVNRPATSSSKLAGYSNRGGSVHVAAPGTFFKPSLNGSGIRTRYSGTSFAAPVVTRTIGHMLRVNPSLTPEMIKTIIRDTVIQPKCELIVNGTLWRGLINELCAIQEAENLRTAVGPAAEGNQGLNRAQLIH